MKRETVDQHPITDLPYCIPLNQGQIINNAITEMMDERLSKDHSRLRQDRPNSMSVDFRSLNKIVKPVSFRLPLIDNVLCLLGKAKYFNALALKSGYWQVELEDSSQEKQHLYFTKHYTNSTRCHFG